MLREPLSLSPVPDYEMFQRHIAASYEDAWSNYRQWPSYDPSFLDDVLHVRAKHTTCGFGAFGTDCVDNDTDSDLYTGTSDNCPTVSNSSQTDTDGDGKGDACDNCPTVSNPNHADAESDGIGDACDTCTDRDHDGYGDPALPTSGCPSGSAGDCLDTDASVHPGAIENSTILSTCNNGKDDDCDGWTDIDCGIAPTTNPTTVNGEGQVSGGVPSNLGPIPDGNLYQSLVETRVNQSTPYLMTQVYKITVPANFANIPLVLKVEGLDPTSNDNYLIHYAHVSSTCPTTSGWTSANLTITHGASEPGTLQSAAIGSAGTTVWCVRFQDDVRTSDSSQSTLSLDRLFLMPQ